MRSHFDYQRKESLMIPFDPRIFFYFFLFDLILWITPLFILMTLFIVVRIFYVARKEKEPFWKRFFKRKILAFFAVLVFIITGVLSFISYDIIQLKLALSELSSEETYEKYEQQARNQKKRQNFILEHDHKYGEFIFPKGTLINRYDPSDNGEESYPLILSGLRSAAFPEPMEIAGVLATKIEATRGLVELAEDQEIGPIHYYSSKYGEYGGWVVDRTTPTIFCPKGSVALFEKPSGPDLDLDDKFWWKEKDGAEAHFKPSEWQFRSCDHRFTVEILPAFGSEEAIAMEKAEQDQRREEDRKSQTIIKDGVLMDAEEIEIESSFYLEAMGQYQFTAKRSGLEEDYQKAYELFEQAAENDEKEAYYDLGMMNLYGEGVPKNREKAFYWFEKAANTGDDSAVAQIGTIYLKDESVRDYDLALSFFNQAAAKGNLTAEFYLGLMFVQGLGVKQDYQTALEWFKKASHPQHAFGMTGVHPISIQAVINIGRIYAEGLVEAEDSKSAEPWFEKACYLNSEQACELWESVKPDN